MMISLLGHGLETKGEPCFLIISSPIYPYLFEVVIRLLCQSHPVLIKEVWLLYDMSQCKNTICSINKITAREPQVKHTPAS